MALSPDSDLAGHVLWAGGVSTRAHYPPLDDLATADVAVIGAGFMGLMAALTLAENGREVRVLDAAEPGAGASGRNAAHVMPGWAKHLPEHAIRRFGPTDGAVMNQIAAGAARELFAFIRRNSLDCAARPVGQLSVVRKATALRGGAARAAAWSAAGTAVDMLSAADVMHYLDVAGATGGWIYRDGGTLNPLALCRELARLCVTSGVGVHGSSAVNSIAPSGQGWVVRTATGAVTARHVVIAANAYGRGLWPDLDRAGYPVRCAMLASTPLANRAALRWPGPWAIADDATVFGVVVEDDGTLSTSVLPGAGYMTPARLTAVADRKLRRYLPSLEKVTWQKCWAGDFMLTPDGFPKIVNPAPNLYAGFGCNGAGIAMAPAMGRIIAHKILALDSLEARYPLSPPSRAPLSRALPWAIRNILIPLAHAAGG